MRFEHTTSVSSKCCDVANDGADDGADDVDDDDLEFISAFMMAPTRSGASW